MKGRRPCPEGWPVARAFASPVSGAACACCSSPGRLAGPCSRCFGPSPAGPAPTPASARAPAPAPPAAEARSAERLRDGRQGPPEPCGNKPGPVRRCAPLKKSERRRSRSASLHRGLAADNVAHFQVGSALGRWPMDCRAPLTLTPQTAGGCAATSPLLPELVPEGNSAGEALQNVKDALAAAIELYEDLVPCRSAS